MTSITITARPIFHFVIPENLLKLLMEASLHHYDATCREQCEPRGFLHTHKKLQDIQKEPREIQLDMREANILMKISENTLFMNETDKQSARELAKALSKAFDYANNEMFAWSHAIP